jgi:PAS domain S-box-containing protein
MHHLSEKTMLAEIEELRMKLAEANQLIQAIKAGEVDAFAMGSDATPEVYTLQSGDYAYRILIEEIGEGALNVTEDGLIVYTNAGFFELVGLSYDKVIGTNVFDYIHPGSAASFKTLFQGAGKNKTKGEIDLLVNDITIPVYISLTSLQPNLPTVGIIVSDQTQKKKHETEILRYQQSLEENNRVLTHKNDELASFAYVASHDLQEPLRKIRLFTTFIQEKAAGGLPPEIAGYFDRIMNGAQRMQVLIRALLEYSRVGNAAGTFVPTDLNQLVAEVNTTLSETIEENHATIAISALPEVPVIPHQISQLFSNLLLNSIKYKKESTDPFITISTQLIDSRELPVKTPQKAEKFWQISVTDNGIGFDPAFSERIFEVFQRLHNANQYEGTGIGLAICRKIMQTHGGHITAEGRPGIGATFHIYLPFIR